MVLQKTMRLDDLLKNYAPGSYGPEWTWEEEGHDLLCRDRTILNELTTDIERNGIKEPILLGDDGRVWDGHHRIIVAISLKLQTVPVTFA